MKSPRYWRIRLFDAVLLGWVALILLGGRANAQAVRFDEIASTTSAQCASGKICPLNVLPGTTVNFCSGQNAGTVNTSGKVVTWVSGQVFSTSWTGQISINGTSQQIQFVTSTTSLTLVASVGTLTGVTYSSLSACLASAATTYTDFTAVTPCSSTAQLTPQTGGACLSTANNQGEFGAWLLPGQYSYYLRVPTTAGGGTYGPYPINVGASSGCPLGGTCDANYQTLAAACTAAGAGTLYVTRNWPATPTQSLACALTFLGNGRITTASSAVVTITGTLTAPSGQRIFNTSASSSSILFSGGNVLAVSPQWWGADCSGSADSRAALAAATASSGILVQIALNCTLKVSTSTLTISASKVTVCGAGDSSVITSSAATFDIITVAADDFTLCNLKILGVAVDDTNNTFGISTDAASPALRGKVYGVTFDSVNDGVKLDTANNGWDIHDNIFRHLMGISSGRGYGVLLGRASHNIVHHNFFYGDVGTAGRHAVYFSDGSCYNTVDHNTVDSFNKSNFAFFSTDTGHPNCGNVLDTNTSTNAQVGDSGGAVWELTGANSDNLIVSNAAISPASTCGIAISLNLHGSANSNTMFKNNVCSGSGRNGIQLQGATNPVVAGNILINGSTSSSGTYAAIEITTSSNVPMRDGTDGARLIGNTIYGADWRDALLIQDTAPLAVNTYIAGGNNWKAGTTALIENAGGALLKRGINPVAGTASETIDTTVISPLGYFWEGSDVCANADGCSTGSDTNNYAVRKISGKATTLNQGFEVCNTDTGGDCFPIRFTRFLK